MDPPDYSGLEEILNLETVNGLKYYVYKHPVTGEKNLIPLQECIKRTMEYLHGDRSAKNEMSKDIVK